MAKNDNTYSTAKVGRRQDADKFFMDDDGVFEYYDQEVTGAELKWAYLSSKTVTNYASATLSGGILSLGYGWALLEVLSAETALAASIPAPAGSGARLRLQGHGMLSNGSVTFKPTTGVVINNFFSVSLSAVNINGSAGPEAWVDMVYFAANTWAIVDYQDVSLQAIA